MSKHRPSAYFDLDGTMFRGNLTDELVAVLLASHPVDDPLVIAAERSYSRIARHECTYFDHAMEIVRILMQIMVARGPAVVTEAAQVVVRKMLGRMHLFTRHLFLEVVSTHKIVVITGSQHEVVDPLLSAMNIVHIYGTRFEIKDGSYTGMELYVPVRDKRACVLQHLEQHQDHLEGSIGIGDSDSDIGFLDLVELPIAFNPSFALLQHARKKRWWIVERADEDVMTVCSPTGRRQDFHYDHRNEKQLRKFVHQLVSFPNQLMR